MINLIRCAPIALAVLVGTGSALAQTSIRVDPAAVVGKELGTGSMVSVTARCSGLDKVTGIRFDLEYDPGVLELLWHEPGDFTELAIVGSIPGTFDYSAVPLTAATGDFSIATLHFMVKKTGHTVLKMTGFPLEQYLDPIYTNSDFVEFPFDDWRDGFFSNDGTEAPVTESKVKPPTAGPEPSASAASTSKDGGMGSCGASAGPSFAGGAIAILAVAALARKR